MFRKQDTKIHFVGIGGMGMVYRATDIALGVPVALKLLRPELMHRSDALERFRTGLEDAARKGQGGGGGGGFTLGGGDEDGGGLPFGQKNTWRANLAFTQGLSSGGRVGVTSTGGAILHHEAPVRIRIGDVWHPAAKFIAWAARLGMMPQLDAKVIESALRQIDERRSALSANISPEALCDSGFVDRIAGMLENSPASARMLWLEVPEYGALQHLQEFRRLCLRLKPLGCKLGLKHAGQQFARIAELNDLGLDYLKIDSSIIHGIEHSTGHQVFLRGAQGARLPALPDRLQQRQHDLGIGAR